nr:NAD-dependent epimerase/dehydratase family protein [Streptomyces sp. SID13031]
MSAILIHGAAGFVGTRLVPQFLAQDSPHLILTDRRPMEGFPPDLLGGSAGEIETIQVDSISTLNVGKIDTAIILAGETNVDEALINPSRAFESNVAIAIDAGEWLRANPHARLIYVSSDEVLGESFKPLGEDEPNRPSQPYAASKACAETILECYRDTYGLDLVILRSCNLVGGEQRAPKLIPIAVTCMMNSRAVPVYGAGDQLREWMAVDDLCRALIVLSDRENADAGIYQASSGVWLSVLQVIELVGRALDVEPGLDHVADRLVHDRSYASDSTRLRSVGWKPEVEVAEAITVAAREMARALSEGEALDRPVPTVS